jgi:replicative DNA helicase
MSEFRVDVGNEQVIIAAALRNDGVRRSLLAQVREDDFLDEQHSLIWRVMRDLHKRGLGFDRAAAVRGMLENGGTDKDVEYLADLERWDGVIQNLRHHVELLRWDAQRDAAFRDHLPGLVDGMRDGREEPDRIRGMVRRLNEMVHGGSTGAVYAPIQVYRDHAAALDRRMQSENPVYGIGHEVFDERLGRGFEPGTQTLYVGLSGAGKSCIALNKAMWFAQQGRKPLYFLWETKSVSAMDVVVASHTGIPYHDLIRGNLDEDQRRLSERASAEWVERIRFAGKLAKRVPASSTGRRRLTNADMLDQIASAISESGCDIVFYDLWLRGMVERNPDAIEQTLGEMQDLHESLDVHGIMLHQINLKDVERRKDKRPTRDAIKGVGGYVEYSDQIFAVIRPNMFVPGLEDDITEIECWKLKDAKWPWITRWQWEGAQQRISDPTFVEPGEGSKDDGFDLDDVGAGGR